MPQGEQVSRAGARRSGEEIRVSHPICWGAFASLSPLGQTHAVLCVEEEGPRFKTKARSIRAGLWHRVICIAKAKTLPEMLFIGNEG